VPDPRHAANALRRYDDRAGIGRARLDGRGDAVDRHRHGLVVRPRTLDVWSRLNSVRWDLPVTIQTEPLVSETIGQHVDGIQTAREQTAREQTARGIKQISGVRHAAEDTSRSSATLLQVSRDLAERANAIDKEAAEFAAAI
jgi:hypothetical protein